MIACSVTYEFEQGKTEGFFEYYKPEVLSAGLQSGKLVSGRISVNKHLAMTEAFVSRGAVKDSDKVGHLVPPHALCSNPCFMFLCLDVCPAGRGRGHPDRRAGVEEQDGGRGRGRRGAPPQVPVEEQGHSSRPQRAGEGDWAQFHISSKLPPAPPADPVPQDEGRSWSRGADVQPTGRVVGVLERSWRDTIATLPR